MRKDFSKLYQIVLTMLTNFSSFSPIIESTLSYQRPVVCFRDSHRYIPQKLFSQAKIYGGKLFETNKKTIITMPLVAHENQVL